MRVAVSMFFAVLTLLCAEPAFADCPSLLIVDSTDGIHYIVSFSAPAATVAAFHVTAYGKDAVYAADLPNVAIRTALTWRSAPLFRSGAIVLLNTDREPLLGVTFAPSDPACRPEDRTLMGPKAMAAWTRSVDTEWAALAQTVVAEAGNGSTATPLGSVAAAPPACSRPFANAALDRAAIPNYPDSARLNGTAGVALIQVTLDESGTESAVRVFRSSGDASLNVAALDAAKTSTYFPQVFACRPRRGSYIFRADFSIAR
jgi:TonB family protein